jgi:hypothetical protein
LPECSWGVTFALGSRALHFRRVLAIGLCTLVMGAAPGILRADDESAAAPPTKKLNDSSTGKNGTKLNWLPQRPEPSAKRIDHAVMRADCEVPADAPAGPMRANRRALRSAAPSTTQSVETTTKAFRDPFGDKKATSEPAPAESINGELKPVPSEPSLSQTVPAEPLLEQAAPPKSTPDRTAPTERKGERYLPGLTPAMPSLTPAAPNLAPAAPDLMPELPAPSTNGDKSGKPPILLVPPAETRSKKTEARQPQLSQQEAITKEHEIRQTCPSPKDLKKIRDLTTNITPEAGDLPQDCPLGNDVFQPRCWSSTTFAWTASSLCHKPLYFDDTSLEVYGHMWGPLVQPIFSGARFFGTFFILPYEMGLELPGECIYALGDYRPGDCAPYQLDPLPLSVRAALFEAGAWTGGAILFH